MVDVPQYLSLERHRDRNRRGVRWRRSLIALLVLIMIAALLDVFGQRPTTSSSAVPAAKLSINAPDHVRGGLIYQARIHIQARREIKDAQLVLATGWLEGMTINTIVPTPVSEGSRNGRLVLGLGHVRAGQRYLLYMQLQVNPTNVGRRSQRVELFDGDRLLTSIDRTVTVFP